MKVKELIALLKNMPQDDPVYFLDMAAIVNHTIDFSGEDCWQVFNVVYNREKKRVEIR